MTETSATAKTETYTDAQATDEAVLLLVRKLRRLHTDVYVELIGKLPEGARWALTLADNRADLLRHVDKTRGTVREYPTVGDGEDEGE